MIKSNFSLREAAKYGGFKTPYMVDYLCRQKILVPSGRSAPGRGRKRLFSFGDLVLLRAINCLLASGLPVSRLKKALRQKQKHFRDMTPETAIRRFIITNGKDVLLEDEPGKMVNLTSNGQLEFAFIVDIHNAREQVTKEIVRASVAK